MVSATKSPNKKKEKLQNKKVKLAKAKQKTTQKVSVAQMPPRVEEPWKVKADKIKAEREQKNKDFVLPSASITGKTVTTCLNAIEKLAEHYKKGNKLFEDETAIFLEIHCIKIQSNKGNITW